MLHREHHNSDLADCLELHHSCAEKHSARPGCLGHPLPPGRAAIMYGWDGWKMVGKSEVLFQHKALEIGGSPESGTQHSCQSNTKLRQLDLKGTCSRFNPLQRITGHPCCDISTPRFTAEWASSDYSHPNAVSNLFYMPICTNTASCI